VWGIMNKEKLTIQLKVTLALPMGERVTKKNVNKQLTQHLPLGKRRGALILSTDTLSGRETPLFQVVETKPRHPNHRRPFNFENPRAVPEGGTGKKNV